MFEIEIRTVSTAGGTVVRRVSVAEWKEERVLPLLRPHVAPGVLAVLDVDGTPVSVLVWSGDDALRAELLPVSTPWEHVDREWHGGDDDE